MRQMSRGAGAGRARRRRAGLLVVVSAVVLGGCIDLKQEVLVMPDGSGKLKVTFGMNEKGMRDAMSCFGGGGARWCCGRTPPFRGRRRC